MHFINYFFLKKKRDMTAKVIIDKFDFKELRSIMKYMGFGE